MKAHRSAFTGKFLRNHHRATAQNRVVIEVSLAAGGSGRPTEVVVPDPATLGFTSVPEMITVLVQKEADERAFTERRLEAQRQALRKPRSFDLSSLAEVTDNPQTSRSAT